MSDNLIYSQLFCVLSQVKKCGSINESIIRTSPVIPANNTINFEYKWVTTALTAPSPRHGRQNAEPAGPHSDRRSRYAEG